MDYIKIRFGKDLLGLHNRSSKTIDEMLQQVNPPMGDGRKGESV
jgi:hypothetical protein